MPEIGSVELHVPITKRVIDNYVYKDCKFYLVALAHNRNNREIMLVAGRIFVFFDPEDNSITKSCDENYVRLNYKVLCEINNYVSISASVPDSIIKNL